MEQKKIIISGAGLVGSLLAVLLGKKGYKVTVIERRPDMRKVKISAGRSINLAMSSRGWRALDKAGVSEQVKQIAMPMYKRTMHDVNGNLSFQPYGLENQAIYSVSRALLNKILLDNADADPDITFLFNRRLSEVNLEQKKITIRNEEDDSETEMDYDFLFGCDGAYSAVRHRLLFNEMFSYSQTYIDHGYKEFHMQPSENGKHKMDVETLHIWPRGEFMMIALPNPDGTYTCTLFYPWKGKESFEQIRSDADIQRLFQTHFPDLIPLIPDYIQQFHTNPTSTLMYVKCGPWNYKNEVLLLGDAAHAIVPFYGQGMNAGFEDCRIFTELLDAHDWNFEACIPSFAQMQEKHGHAIADLAMRNFVEMRDLTADPAFLLRKKIEKKMYEKYPQDWIPLYSMVTFEEVPYHDAIIESQKQDKVMEQIMKISGLEDKWDSEEVLQEVLRLKKAMY